MAITFQVLSSDIAFPPLEQVYGIEPVKETFDLTKLTSATASALTTQPAAELPKALIWDDLIIKRVKLEARPYVMQWPQRDSLLNQQVSHRGRCAIRTDILHALYRDQKIPDLTDTSAALYQLGMAEPESITKVPNVVRFTGLGSSSDYAPIRQPAPPPQTASSISVIINYRDRPELMAACLSSLAKQTLNATLEVILVDNQSQRENRQQVEHLARELFPASISVIHLTYDAPFNHSAQTNLAVEASTGEVLFMLNNDATLLAPNTVQTLSDWALTPKIASVGPQFVGKGDRLISAGVEVYPPSSVESGGIRESTVKPLAQAIRYTAGNSFACSAIARDVWSRVGGLDADAFHSQYNDADYDLKSLTLGFRHLYIGTLKVYHQPGQSETKTLEQGEHLHSKVLARYVHFQEYVAFGPVLVEPSGPVLNQILNPSKVTRAFTVYRKLRSSLPISSLPV